MLYFLRRFLQKGYTIYSFFYSSFFCFVHPFGRIPFNLYISWVILRFWIQRHIGEVAHTFGWWAMWIKYLAEGHNWSLRLGLEPGTPQSQVWLYLLSFLAWRSALRTTCERKTGWPGVRIMWLGRIFVFIYWHGTPVRQSYLVTPVMSVTNKHVHNMTKK